MGMVRGVCRAAWAHRAGGQELLPRGGRAGQAIRATGCLAGSGRRRQSLLAPPGLLCLGPVSPSGLQCPEGAVVPFRVSTGEPSRVRTEGVL